MEIECWLVDGNVGLVKGSDLASAKDVRASPLPCPALGKGDLVPVSYIKVRDVRLSRTRLGVPL